MDLLGYFRVLRRRWLVIVVLMLVGAGLGYASTLLNHDPVKTRTYYKSTATLQLDPQSTDVNPSAFSSVEQVAVYVTTGVPDAVAKDVGTTESGRELAEHVVTLTNSVPNTLDITYTDPDAQRATQLADAFADQLVKNLDERAQTKFDDQRDSLTKQTTQLNAQANGFLAQTRAVPPPPDVDTIQKQYDATQNEYYQAYAQLQALNSQGPPPSQLTKLQGASAIPISEGEYESRLSLGASGQNNLRVENSSTDPVISVSTSSAPTVNGPVSRSLLGAL